MLSTIKGARWPLLRRRTGSPVPLNHGAEPFLALATALEVSSIALLTGLVQQVRKAGARGTTRRRRRRRSRLPIPARFEAGKGVVIVVVAADAPGGPDRGVHVVAGPGTMLEQLAELEVKLI
ncbi:hypothetical protein SLS62_002184 [Diatrype stigma]|uniref:Uncharacterized protein n=1 Tax=Diatrype stigma TaxID=117547 RepID=A0AAN9YV92_9PEZI